MSWIAVWDASGACVVRDQDLLDRPDRSLPVITLILEGTLGSASDRPVRLWSGSGDDARALALYAMPNGELRLYHGEVEFRTRPNMLAPGETFQLMYHVDRVANTARIDLRNLHRSKRQFLRVAAPVEALLSDLMPANPRYLDRISVAALASHPVPIGPVPCYEAGTPIDTPVGPVRVEDLRPGMVVSTLSRGPQTVRWCGTREVLGLGAMAPILLRAPYFGLPCDIRLSRHTRILLTGPEVEYLSGRDQVFIPAGDLVNGVSVLRDQTTPIRRFHHFMLDDHDCVRVGRCRIETLLLGDKLAEDGHAIARPAECDLTPAVPTLDRPSAQSLLAMLSESRRVAA